MNRMKQKWRIRSITGLFIVVNFSKILALESFCLSENLPITISHSFIATSFFSRHLNKIPQGSCGMFQETKQENFSTYFSKFENFYFHNTAQCFFVIGDAAEITRSFNVSDRRGYFWGEPVWPKCPRVVTVPGTTIMVFERGVTPWGSTHFFHFLEHLLGIWNFGGELSRQEVQLFLLAGNGQSVPSDWRGSNELVCHLIKALFPNAAIKTWDDFMRDTQWKTIYFEKAITSDRSMDIFKQEPYYTERMLGGYFQALKKESLDHLISLVWKYFDVMKCSSDKLKVTYLKRLKNRTLVPDCEKELIDKIRALPNVELQVVDFETISFGQQVSIAANTDVLIGVHGNGLSHTLFLPDGATLIELFPENSFRVEYRIFAKSRGLKYFGWIDKKGWIDDQVAESVGVFGEILVQSLTTDVPAIIDVLKTLVKDQM